MIVMIFTHTHTHDVLSPHRATVSTNLTRADSSGGEKSHNARVSLPVAEAKTWRGAALKASQLKPREPQNRELNNNNNNAARRVFDHRHPPAPQGRLQLHHPASTRSHPCSLFACTSVSFPPSFSLLPPLSASLSLHLSIWVCLSLLTVSPCKYPARATAPAPAPLSLHLRHAADGWRASPGLPTGPISADGVAELRQIDDKACRGRSLLVTDRLHLKVHVLHR